MTKPIAICIEDLDSEAARYVRCVALPGRQPGLRLDEAGGVLWRSDDGVSCELWATADQRLALYRPEGAGVPVTLHRAGRSLDVPCGKPVILVDQDRINVASRRLRVHVHGEAPAVAAPSLLAARPGPLGRLRHAVAAAAVIGAAAAACSDIEVVDQPPVVAEPTPTVDIRDQPPEVMPMPTIAEAVQGEWTVALALDAEGERAGLLGVLAIREGTYRFEPAGEVTAAAMPGDLGFLFDAPSGEVTMDYQSGVAAEDWVDYHAPGTVLATCTFEAGGAEVGKLLLVAGSDYGTLGLESPSGASDEWRITR